MYKNYFEPIQSDVDKKCVYRLRNRSPALRVKKKDKHYRKRLRAVVYLHVPVVCYILQTIENKLITKKKLTFL